MNDQVYLYDLLRSTYPGVPVYYRPNEFELTYPCIVYDMTNLSASHSNNVPYVVGTTFSVTLMSLAPMSYDPKPMLGIFGMAMVRTFITDNIVHNLYEITINSM